MAILGVAGLWLDRGDLKVRLRDFIKIAASIILAIFIIAIKGRYFPNSLIQWSNHVTNWGNIMASSGLDYVESILVICMCIYIFIRATLSNYFVSNRC
jgi:hypothetical protein